MCQFIFGDYYVWYDVPSTLPTLFYSDPFLSELSTFFSLISAIVSPTWFSQQFASVAAETEEDIMDVTKETPSNAQFYKNEQQCVQFMSSVGGNIFQW